MKIKLTADVDLDARIYIASAFCNRERHPDGRGTAEESPATREEVEAYLARVLPFVVNNPFAILGCIPEDYPKPRSAIFCEHANENPSRCPCKPGCYCRSHTCKDKR